MRKHTRLFITTGIAFVITSGYVAWALFLNFSDHLTPLTLSLTLADSIAFHSAFLVEDSGLYRVAVRFQAQPILASRSQAWQPDSTLQQPVDSVEVWIQEMVVHVAFGNLRELPDSVRLWRTPPSRQLSWPETEGLRDYFIQICVPRLEKNTEYFLTGSISNVSKNLWGKRAELRVYFWLPEIFSSSYWSNADQLYIATLLDMIMSVAFLFYLVLWLDERKKTRSGGIEFT